MLINYNGLKISGFLSLVAEYLFSALVKAALQGFLINPCGFDMEKMRLLHMCSSLVPMLRFNSKLPICVMSCSWDICPLEKLSQTTKSIYKALKKISGQ